MRLVIAPLAQDDIDEAAAFIVADSPAAAERFLLNAQATFTSLLSYPAKGRLHKFRAKELRALRSVSIKGFPRRLAFYLHDGTRVLIVRVLEGSRDQRAVFGPLIRKPRRKR